MVKACRWVASLVLLVSLLSGCVYSGRVKQEGAPPSGEYVVVVQSAVDQFQKQTGVLPIKTKEQNTPIYEKYQIDFKKLQDRRLLSVIPTNAFENGGTAIYVLVNVETKPEVKLMELTVYQKMVALQKDVDDYKAKHGGSLPLGEEAYPGLRWLDFKKLNVKKPELPSPYSRVDLNVVIDDEGELALDYGPDLVKQIAKSNASFSKDDDLRTLLVANSYYVPARSFPYRWNGQEPVMLRPNP